VDGYSHHDHQKRDLQVSGKKGSWFLERVGNGQRGEQTRGISQGESVVGILISTRALYIC
jgi:hypothetical protein